MEVRNEKMNDNNDTDKVGGEGKAGRGFYEGSAEEMDNDKEEGGEENVAERGRAEFKLGARFQEKETKNSKGEERKEAKTEVISEMEEKFRNRRGGRGEYVRGGNVVESKGGGCTSIVVDTGTSEPTDKETNNNAEKAGKKPERGSSQGFMTN